MVEIVGPDGRPAIVLPPTPHYSPSQTSDYAFCPRYWAARQEGWRYRIAYKKDEAAAAGIGFSAAMCAWYGRRVPMPVEVGLVREAQVIEIDDPLGTAILAGLSAYDQEIAHWEKHGVAYDSEKVAENREALVKVIRKYCDNDPMPKSWTVVEVETPIPGEGNLRPDLVCKDEIGKLVPVDFKLKLEVKKQEWRAKWLGDFTHSWQQHHQATAFESDRYVVVPVVAAPFSRSWEVYPFSLTQRSLFQKTALHLWNQISDWRDLMELAKSKLKSLRPWHLPGAAVHSNQYGDCEFIAVCPRGMTEESLRGEGFIQVERRDK